MAYHPIFLDIDGKPCVVIGGGTVAERKIRSLLDSGAKVTVISPEVTPGIENSSVSGGLPFIDVSTKMVTSKGT